MNDKLKGLALDLASDYPRSPRVTLGGYVIAARAVDKARAELAGTNGEYHYNCGLDQLFLNFSEINPEELKDFLATGADDEAVDKWIAEKAKKRERIEVIKWNNDLRYKRLNELPDKVQEYMEDYIPKFVPAELIPRINSWFDIYDAEEKRLKA